MPSSVNVPSSISSASRSRAVSFSRLVLAGDLLLAPAEPRLLAALVQVLHQRAQRRAGDERVRGRRSEWPCGAGYYCQSERDIGRPAASRRDAASSSGSSTCMAVEAAAWLSASSSGASKAVTSTPTSSHSADHRLEHVVELVRRRARRAPGTGRGTPRDRSRRGRGARRPGAPSSAFLTATSVSTGLAPITVTGALSSASRSARVEVAHAGEHHALGWGTASRRGPRPSARRRRARRHAAQVAAGRGVGRVEVRRGRPATARARRAAGAASAGRVVRAIEHSAARSTGRLAADSASSTCPPASSRQPRDAAQVLVVAAARLGRLADHARLAPSRSPTSGASSSTPRPAAGVRSEVRQRSATKETLIAPSTSARASRRTPARPPRRPLWTARG